MEFLRLKSKAFGLDLSDLSIKIVNLKNKGKFFKLASWGEVKMKPGIVEGGEIKKEDALVKNIKKALIKVKGKKIRTKKVVVSLPEKKAFLQVIKMPKMTEEELQTAVPFEAENYIPLPIEEVYLDFQVVPSLKGNLSNQIDVLIAAIPKKIVDSYLLSLKKAGLFPQALEVESQSISRALIKNGLSPQPVLLFDFGKSRSTFIIFSGYSLRFTSSILISSHKLTQAIAQSLKIDLAEAEKLKIKYGLKKLLTKKKVSKQEKIKQNKVYQAILPVLTNLVEQIKRYLDYYQTHARNGHSLLDGQRVSKILLCGRGANLKGLTDFLASELKVPVELGNPWVNVLPAPLKEVPELPFEDSLGYTTALGLALRGVKGE